MNKKNKPDTKNLKKRGDTWHICATVNGVTIRKSLHTDDLSVAQQRRDTILTPMRANMDERQMLKSVKRQLEGIKAEDEQRKAKENRGILLGKAWDIFVNDPTRQACANQTLCYHKSNWTRFLGWLRAHYPSIAYSREVTRAICTEWAAEELKEAKATNTYNHYISSVRYVFKSILNLDEEWRNPMDTIHKRKDTDCVPKEMFTDEELHKIFAVGGLLL